MVMTLLGDTLSTLQRRTGRISSVSTQTRVGINVLFGVKQIHDVGFVHRDLKPANVAVGQVNTPEYRFLHILDFGLAREFIVRGEDKKLQMRRPRPRALFRGTTRYCSVNTHDKGEQGRVDDLWSVLYMLAEMRGRLPWANLRDKKDICESKRSTTHERLLGNSPVHLVKFARHLDHPNYAYIFNQFMEIMKAGKFKFTDPFDWEPKTGKEVKKQPKTVYTTSITTAITKGISQAAPSVDLPLSALNDEGIKVDSWNKFHNKKPTEENPFPAAWFSSNPLGF